MIEEKNAHSNAKTIKKLLKEHKKLHDKCKNTIMILRIRLKWISLNYYLTWIWGCILKKVRLWLGIRSNNIMKLQIIMMN